MNKKTFAKAMTAGIGFCGIAGREQVYWYTPSECTIHKTKWPLLWFLQCGRCKQKRDHARRMQDLATRKQRRMHHILGLLEYEEGRILGNILWQWRRLAGR